MNITIKETQINADEVIKIISVKRDLFRLLYKHYPQYIVVPVCAESVLMSDPLSCYVSSDSNHKTIMGMQICPSIAITKIEDIQVF